MASRSTNQVPCDLTYVTLRAAFLLSLDGLLRYSLEPSKSERTGSDLLHFYPPLAGMAPQIQMETVLRTWNRWTHSNHSSPSPLEARILFAATELLASLATDRQNPLLRVVFEGPRDVHHLNNHWLPSRVRCLQLSRENGLSQGILQELTISSAPCEQLVAAESPAFEGEVLEALGRWRVHPQMLQWGEGLLTDDEMELVRDFFEEHPGLSE
ncbi:MAG TPA: hypothetical protein DC058_22765 [Planctomycetaceae bacterium]|jgi:hypothetical protein|nr:hypothetical protein [Planctomycetaceae bacterium]HBC64024.1 hypothetical protein [Planctomycetaceae bacterium]